MFLKGEDLYYLVYNTLILLRGLSCDSQEKSLHDYSKIALLIDFVADSRLLRIITSAKQNNLHIGDTDKHLLQSAYTEGLVRRHIVSRLIFALEKQKIVSLEVNKKKGIVLIWLETKGIPSDYFNTNLYDAEFENVELIRKLLPRLRTLKLDAMLARLFTDYGVLTWHV